MVCAVVFGLQKPCGVLLFIKYVKAVLFIFFCFAMQCFFGKNLEWWSSWWLSLLLSVQRMKIGWDSWSYSLHAVGHVNTQTGNSCQPGVCGNSESSFTVLYMYSPWQHMGASRYRSPQLLSIALWMLVWHSSCGWSGDGCVNASCAEGRSGLNLPDPSIVVHSRKVVFSWQGKLLLLPCAALE